MKKKYTGILVFFAIVCVVATICFLILAIKELHPEQVLEQQNEELRENVIMIANENVPNFGTQNADNFSAENKEYVEDVFRIIDFEALKAINPDIIAWIYIPGTGIDYPILKGTTLEHYLNHTYNNTYNELGSIFTHPETDERLQQGQIHLFGHRMKSGQMFSRLTNYQESAYALSHPVYVYTPDEMRKYEVIAYYTCATENSTFQENPDIAAYVKIIRENAQYFLEEKLSNQEEISILTLSTCPTRNSEEYRVVVQCILTEVGGAYANSE